MSKLFESILRENSKTVKVYHGSFYHNDDLSVSERENSYGHGDQAGLWFSDNKHNAATYGPYMISAALDLRNAMIVDCEGLTALEFADHATNINRLSVNAKREGYDVLVLQNITDCMDDSLLDDDSDILSTQYAVFNKKCLSNIKRIQCPVDFERYDDQYSYLNYVPPHLEDGRGN